MEIYTPMSNREFSQRKLEEYSKMSKIIQWGEKSSFILRKFLWAKIN